MARGSVLWWEAAAACRETHLAKISRGAPPIRRRLQALPLLLLRLHLPTALMKLLEKRSTSWDEEEWRARLPRATETKQMPTSVKR